MAQKLVIVGAGMAAAYLLQELSRLDHGLHITLIGEEPDACYNRVMLSALLAGEAAESDLAMLSTDQLHSPNRLLTGTRVRAVNLRQQTLLTDNNETLSYDRLVFATGATVATPDIGMSGVEGIRVLRTLEDVRHLQCVAAQGRRAVVVGGGLLGLEAAHGLNGRGFDTSVVHRQPYLMNRQLDAEGGEHLRERMAQSGLQFFLQASVAALRASDGKLHAIVLQDGRELACDLLVFATGIEPSMTLAREAGVACERGVLVDAYLHTSDPNCYALGECSQMGTQCFGLVAPVKAQAVVLARQLAGADGPAFALEDWPVQLKVSGVEIFSAGSVQSGDEHLVLRDAGSGVYRHLALAGQQLVGAVLVGDKRDGIWYAQLIRDAADVSGYRSGLMFGKAVSEAMRLSAVAA